MQLKGAVLLQIRGRTEVKNSPTQSGEVLNVELAAALMHKPQLLVLDEPSTGLDYEARRELWHLLEELRGEGTALLLATHDFGSRSLLRGSFGLITGRGSCRFRDVRYLAREVGDQAAAIEREIQMEEMRIAGGGAVGGSYAGVVPPFPQVDEWLQGSRVDTLDINELASEETFASRRRQRSG